MSSESGRAAIVIALLMTTSACDAGFYGGDAGGPARATQPLPERDATAVPIVALRTTSATIAVGNLGSQLNALLQLRQGRPNDVDVVGRIVDIRLARARFLGKSWEFGVALEEAATLARNRPHDAAAQLLEARVLGALHRFDDAWAAIDRAESSGAPPGAVRDAREVITVARGSGDRAGMVAAATARVATRGSFENYSALARAQWHAGDYAAADAAFVAALDAYPDVSPFPVAWVDFQRGLMWAETADRPDVAYALYDAAATRLPHYHTAAVHLAELEAERGNLGRARALLEAVVDQVEDPEVLGKLGELIVGEDPTRADLLLAEATRRYDALLWAFPLAYADHGAEFFSARGDHPRAIALATANVANRPSAGAYDLAIHVALDAGDRSLACRLAEEARSVVPDPVLTTSIARADSQCRVSGAY